MEEWKRAEQAKSLFLQGYNCAQSVAGAFADVIGLPFAQTVRLASGFGGGIGRLREVCGAMCGSVLVLSAVYGYEDAKAFEAKKQLYEEVQAVAAGFVTENGFLRCRDLLGLDRKAPTPAEPEQRTGDYYKKRPCAEIVYTAAKILEKHLQQEKKLEK